MTQPSLGPRTPRYGLRRGLALGVIRSWKPRVILEAGPGDGALLREMSFLVDRAEGVELGADVRKAAEELVSDRPNVRIHKSWNDPIRTDFDCLVALEVLEHLENHHEELRGWATHLRSGGIAVLSVPAHMHLWSDADEAVGHQRRYSRSDIYDLLRAGGLIALHVWSYGFPLTSVTRVLRRGHTRGQALQGDAMERTLASAQVSYSGLGQSRWIGGLLRFVGGAGHIAQLPFRETELGDGWFVIAQKP